MSWGFSALSANSNAFWVTSNENLHTGIQGRALLYWMIVMQSGFGGSPLCMREHMKDFVDRNSAFWFVRNLGISVALYFSWHNWCINFWTSSAESIDLPESSWRINASPYLIMPGDTAGMSGENRKYQDKIAKEFAVCGHLYANTICRNTNIWCWFHSFCSVSYANDIPWFTWLFFKSLQEMSLKYIVYYLYIW